MMDTFFSLLLNDIPVIKFIVFYIYGVVGILTSFGLELFGKWKKIQKRGGFKYKYWLNDNWFRFIASFVVLFVGIVTTNELRGSDPSIYNSLIMGLSTDSIIKSFIGRSKYVDDGKTD